MIHPSYTELIQAINSNSEDDDNTMLLNSRYSLVLATSKRARQLVAGEKPLVDGAEGKKALSVAIDEFYQGKVKILAEAPEAADALETKEASEITSESPEAEAAGTSEELPEADSEETEAEQTEDPAKEAQAETDAE